MKGKSSRPKILYYTYLVGEPTLVKSIDFDSFKKDEFLSLLKKYKKLLVVLFSSQ